MDGLDSRRVIAGLAVEELAVLGTSRRVGVDHRPDLVPLTIDDGEHPSGKQVVAHLGARRGTPCHEAGAQHQLILVLLLRDQVGRARKRRVPTPEWRRRSVASRPRVPDG
jgi:hypothetical protein